MNTCTYSKALILLILLSFVSGCSTQESHVPPLWQLPAAAVGNSISNARYTAKRNTIKQYIIAHYDDLKIDIQRGSGMHLDEILSRLNIDNNHTQEIKNYLQKDYRFMFENIEIITEQMMNYYASLYIQSSSAKTKTINGFSYIQATQIIQRSLTNDFDSFRRTVEHKNSAALQPLLNNLNIQAPDNRMHFLEHIFHQYDAYFIEPVVVGMMVHSR